METYYMANFNWKYLSDYKHVPNEKVRMRGTVIIISPSEFNLTNGNEWIKEQLNKLYNKKVINAIITNVTPISESFAKENSNYIEVYP